MADKPYLFKKGQSGNPTGRPKGAKDKKTEQWHKIAEYLLNEGSERYARLLKEQEDDEKFKKDFLAILEYFKPKQVRSDNFNKSEGNLNVNISYGDDSPDKD